MRSDRHYKRGTPRLSGCEHLGTSRFGGGVAELPDVASLQVFIFSVKCSN
jgi:hypothetical protein